MNVKVLGNGGAINDGLPYNAFIINGTLLCETPPDIMLSLHKNDIEIPSINTIYISHFHGDHVFGLPFLILSAFLLHKTDNKNLFFTIVGPEGIEEMAENIVISAFTSNHPCLEWMKAFCNFLEVDESSKPELVGGYQTSIFKLNHLIDTYGFFLTNDDNIVEFSYVADTRWCESIRAVLNRQPRVVMIDLNGKDDDPEPVHISMSELKQKAIPITGKNTQYYGTHLKEEFNSTISCIKCAKPGMMISL